MLKKNRHQQQQKNISRKKKPSNKNVKELKPKKKRRKSNKNNKNEKYLIHQVKELIALRLTFDVRCFVEDENKKSVNHKNRAKKKEVKDEN